jgi:mortality factor 4-like protein 1
MAPSTSPTFFEDEKVLCFHHEMLYEAKILDIRPLATAAGSRNGTWEYKVHYKGWKNT